MTLISERRQPGRRAAWFLSLLALPAAVLAEPPPNTAQWGSTSLSWGGYLKADALYSRFSEGRVAQGPARDFYLPGAIPVSGGDGRSYSVLDAHAKETRLFLSARTEYEGHQLGGHVELDFIVNQGAGDERITNAYNPGLRRAFVTFDRWLAGQEWTTFMNLGAVPETLDFVAFPSEGTVFVRQPQLRYSRGGFAVALENPETTVEGGGPAHQTQDGRVPDLIARQLFAIGEARFAVAGLLRQLRVDAANPLGIEGRATAYGISVSGRVPLGGPDLRFMLTHGDGLGRYVALSAVPDAVVEGSGIDTVRLTAGYLAYRQPWSPRWRSTVTYARLQAEDRFALKAVESVSANLLYSPVAKVTVGGEYRHARRTQHNDDDGALDRLQFSVKYVF